MAQGEDAHQVEQLVGVGELLVLELRVLDYPLPPRQQSLVELLDRKDRESW